MDIIINTIKNAGFVLVFPGILFVSIAGLLLAGID